MSQGISQGIDGIRAAAMREIAGVSNAQSLKMTRIKYLGRKGALTILLRSLKNLPLHERKQVGLEANAVKKILEEAITAKAKELERDFRSPTTIKRFDVTRPGAKIRRGSLHPLTKIDEEIRTIFTAMNFSVFEGPEVETEYYNFDALNIPAHHPAREMWDTFWLKSGSKTKNLKPKTQNKFLLRTHTSPMQIRYMETHTPPFQIIVPGRVFRYEATDASHEINFYQVEGLMVGHEVTLANFKYVVEEFFKRFFRKKIEFRYRPSYFPFVEPGLEVEIRLGGKWLEVMGAGMVHRRVFDMVRYNPNEVQGFAFGMGLDRLAMIKYGIPDIRLFYSGDVRFIRQF